MTAKRLPGVTTAEWGRAQKRSEKAKKTLEKVLPLETWLANQHASGRVPSQTDIELYKALRKGLELDASDPMACVQEIRVASIKRPRPAKAKRAVKKRKS